MRKPKQLESYAPARHRNGPLAKLIETPETDTKNAGTDWSTSTSVRIGSFARTRLEWHCCVAGVCIASIARNLQTNRFIFFWVCQSQPQVLAGTTPERTSQQLWCAPTPSSGS